MPKPELICHLSPGKPAQIAFPYSKNRVQRIRGFTGRRWCPHSKCWEIPQSPTLIADLAATFPELTLKTTSDDPSLVSTAADWHTELARELRLRGYRANTRKAYTGQIRRLVQHFNRDPVSISESDIRAYMTAILESG